MLLELMPRVADADPVGRNRQLKLNTKATQPDTQYEDYVT